MRAVFLSLPPPLSLLLLMRQVFQEEENKARLSRYFLFVRLFVWLVCSEKRASLRFAFWGGLLPPLLVFTLRTLIVIAIAFSVEIINNQAIRSDWWLMAHDPRPQLTRIVFVKGYPFLARGVNFHPRLRERNDDRKCIRFLNRIV